MSKLKPAGSRLLMKLEKNATGEEKRLKKRFNLVVVLKKTIKVVGLLGQLFKAIDKLWDWLSNLF